ncbi:hypothetical protein [Chlamydia vaughanii]|uniref:hypothetical protein n=1 Tax=Chlamydia vaughanii TaxID=3112552 RepID=UPI0032B150EF
MVDANLQVTESRPSLTQEGLRPYSSRPKKIAHAVVALIALTFIVLGSLGVLGTSGTAVVITAAVVLGWVILIQLLQTVLDYRERKRIEARPTADVVEERDIQPEIAEEEEIVDEIPEEGVVRRSGCSSATLQAQVNARNELNFYTKFNFSKLQKVNWGDLGLMPPVFDDLTNFLALLEVMKGNFEDYIAEGDAKGPRYPSREASIQENGRWWLLSSQYIEAAAVVSENSLLEIPFWINTAPDLTSNLEVLASQRLFFRETLLALPDAYCRIRFLHEHCGLIDEATRRLAEEQFYAPDTKEGRCRQIYNDFCKRLRRYLGNIDQAANIDQLLLFEYSQEDTGPDFRQPG